MLHRSKMSVANDKIDIIVPVGTKLKWHTYAMLKTFFFYRHFAPTEQLLCFV